MCGWGGKRGGGGWSLAKEGKNVPLRVFKPPMRRVANICMSTFSLAVNAFMPSAQ